ncbi:MAG: hypothetical protein EHM27_08585, partial [Deltaproteobacteria bacterium]
MKHRIWGIIIVIAAFSFFLGSCAEMAPSVKSDQKTVIRIGVAFKPGHILVDAAEKFKELVGTRSAGRIAVTIEAGTKSEDEVNKLNSAGALEMQSNGTFFLQSYAPPYYFFTGPYVMRDF